MKGSIAGLKCAKVSVACLNARVSVIGLHAPPNRKMGIWYDRSRSIKKMVSNIRYLYTVIKVRMYFPFHYFMIDRST